MCHMYYFCQEFLQYCKEIKLHETVMDGEKIKNECKTFPTTTKKD